MAGNSEKKEHAFRVFSRDLKNDDFPPVLFFYGAEDFLIHWAADSLKNKYVLPGAEAVDYVKLSDDTQSVEQILEACNTFSMFSRRRVDWVKDYTPLRGGNVKGFGASELAKLSDYLDSPNETAILIFSSETINEKSDLVKKLKKTARSYDFCKLDRTQLLGFTEKRLRPQARRFQEICCNIFWRKPVTSIRRRIIAFRRWRMIFKKSSRTAAAA